MLLVSHDDGFVAELATRAMLIGDGKLVPGEIHSHPHVHSHPHILPASAEAKRVHA
jgi:cobalt/nickel transport system ATP-binding protein